MKSFLYCPVRMVTGNRHMLKLVLSPASGVAVPDRDLEEPSVFQGLSIRSVDSVLRPYLSKGRYRSCYPVRRAPVLTISGDYGSDLISEVVRYGRWRVSLPGNALSMSSMPTTG